MGTPNEDNGDIWSLGVVIFEIMQTLRFGYMKEVMDFSKHTSFIDFRELSEDGRKVIVKQTVEDQAL